MEIVFDELASFEYQDTIEFYELEVSGLGIKFKEEVKRALRSISKFPELGTIEREEIRRYILHKFPFKILYSNEKKYLYIIAVAHMHREPHYWISRLKD